MTNPGADLARLRKVAKKTCPVCGREFIARTIAIYCGSSCRMKAAYKSRKNKNGGDYCRK